MIEGEILVAKMLDVFEEFRLDRKSHSGLVLTIICSKVVLQTGLIQHDDRKKLFAQQNSVSQ